MHTIPQQPPEGGWLRARRERRDGGVDLRVHCPRRDHEISVSTCESCGSALALATDDSGLSVYVQCAEADGATPPAGPTPPKRSEVEDPTFVPLTRIMRKTIAVTDTALPAARLAESLLEEGIGAAPVVDPAGRLVGIVTKTDLLALRPADREVTAGDVMSPAPYSLHPDSSVAEAAALMVYEGVHHLPVVDDAGRVVGVVSSLDVTRWVAESAGFHAPAFGPAAARRE